MRPARQTEKDKNKRLKRNFRYGLLPKCSKYGRLDGVELFLGIKYTNKNMFYSYASEKTLSWVGDIPSLVRRPRPPNAVSATDQAR